MKFMIKSKVRYSKLRSGEIPTEKVQFERHSKEIIMNEKENLRQELLDLNKKRDELEKQILAFQSILKSQNVGMNDPLVDNEGYPRNDIDVYAVRGARNKIISYENDIKAIMKQIETLLHKYHSIN